MSEAPSLTVTLETVTPLFLGGADPRGTPELRAPSFRGALRYWLRAALGGVIGDQNLEGLRKLESVVFGSTEYASPIHIRVSGDLNHTKKAILPHKTGQSAGSRAAFDAGQAFDLTMRQLRTDDEAIWKSACAALNLVLTFGGIGLRSRRGYGTLRVAQVSPADGAIVNSPSTLEGWKQNIRDVLIHALDSARQLAQAHQVRQASLPRSPTRFPCASNENLIRLATLAPPHNASAMAAVTHLMSVIPKNQAFGGISPRQSSPLWVRPIQIETGYALLLVVLASNIKPKPNYAAIRKWLDSNFPGQDLTVQGWNA